MSQIEAIQDRPSLTLEGAIPTDPWDVVARYAGILAEAQVNFYCVPFPAGNRKLTHIIEFEEAKQEISGVIRDRAVQAINEAEENKSHEARRVCGKFAKLLVEKAFGCWTERSREALRDSALEAVQIGVELTQQHDGVTIDQDWLTNLARKTNNKSAFGNELAKFIKEPPLATPKN